MKFHLLTSLFVLSISTAISNQASAQDKAAPDYQQELHNARNHCLEQLHTPAGELMRKLIAIEPGQQPTPAMLDNQAHASPEEKQALTTLTPIIVACKKAIEDISNKYLPADYGNLIRTDEILARSIINDLANGKITYATFNTFQVQVRATLQMEFAVLDKKFQTIVEQQGTKNDPKLANVLHSMEIIN